MARRVLSAARVIGTLSNLGRLPFVRMALVWAGYGMLLIALFWLTHGGWETVKNQFQLFLEWFKQNG